ncbi:MAG TPA: alpha/beta hydrolase [Longilinea sp.]|nr:alpha/beta hydrolase [Longilinea sp.]
MLFCYDPAPENKTPVLLLHGLGADGRSWGFQTTTLVNAGYRPIAPDLPGFGKTPAKDLHWDIPTISRLIIDWMQGMFQEPVPVVGISMGGAIALQLALTRQEMISKLVLVNTFACLRPHSLHGISYLFKRFVLASIRGSASQAELVAFHLFPNPDQADLRRAMTELIHESDPRVYRTAMRALAVFDVRKRLNEIRVPTLVITGALDTTVPLEIQDELALGIPGAQHVIIPGGRHAVIADQADRFNEIMLGFLQLAEKAKFSRTHLRD